MTERTKENRRNKNLLSLPPEYSKTRDGDIFESSQIELGPFTLNAYQAEITLA